MTTIDENAIRGTIPEENPLWEVLEDNFEAKMQFLNIILDLKQKTLKSLLGDMPEEEKPRGYFTTREEMYDEGKIISRNKTIQEIKNIIIKALT